MPDPAPAAPVRTGDLATLALLVALGYALTRGLAPPAAVVALGTAAAVSLAAPAAALAAIVVALPVTFLPVAIGPYRFSPLELAIALAGLSVGLRLVRRIATRAGRGELRRLATPRAVTVPAVALLAAATLSLATVADPSHRHESLREYRLVIVEPLLAFVAARYLLIDPAARRLAVATLLVTGGLVGAAALVEFTRHTGGPGGVGDYRARVAYPHPNHLALFSERVATFAVGLAVAGRVWRGGTRAAEATRRRTGPLILAAAALAAAGGMTTLSRGFVLAVAAGIAAVIALAGAPSWWRWYLAGLGATLVVFAAGAGERLVDAGGLGQVPTRLLIWRASLRMAIDHPLFGVGLDQFLYQYWPRYVEPAGWPERYTSHPHNLLLDLWLRLGILGAAAFAWLAIAVGQIAGRIGTNRPSLDPPRSAGCPLGDRLSRPGPVGDQAPDRQAQDLGGDRAVGVAAAAALAAGVAHGLVDNTFFLPDLAVMTWLCVALLEVARTGDAVPRRETGLARAS